MTAPTNPLQNDTGIDTYLSFRPSAASGGIRTPRLPSAPTPSFSIIHYSAPLAPLRRPVDLRAADHAPTHGPPGLDIVPAPGPNGPKYTPEFSIHCSYLRIPYAPCPPCERGVAEIFDFCRGDSPNSLLTSTQSCTKIASTADFVPGQVQPVPTV